MFWGLGGGGAKATATRARSQADTSRRASQQGKSTADMSVRMTPLYSLSEERRHELLLAARTNRVSWVDGVDERIAPPLPLESGFHPDPFAMAPIPSPCRMAVDDMHDDLSTFVSRLTELKHKILATDTNLIDQEPGAHDTSSTRYHTLFHELREQASRLDQWQRSHSPQTKARTSHDREMTFFVGFRALLTLLKNPQAAELVYRIQSFVKKVELWELPTMLQAVATRDRPGGRIQAFIRKLIEQITHSERLKTLVQGEAPTDECPAYLHIRDASGLDLLHEVLEAFLMEKLYSKLLTPSTSVAEEDDAFHDRMRLLGFVTFKHLDLPVPTTREEEQTWLSLAAQLESMTLRPSPRRKMDIVLRVCQDLTTFLKTQHHGRFPSADEFLPALIYIVLRSNPCELKRNVAFILEYRHPAKLVSEPGYFFTHLVSSIAFLEELDCSRLTILPHEFEEGLRRSKERLGWTRAASCDIDHAGRGETTTDCTLRTTSLALYREKQEQRIPRFLASLSNEVDAQASRRLPTVLDIRAKRRGLLATQSNVRHG
ncbi:hypothetical protein PsorP6_013287 [Peronosclerospora sorghi]|uniref:Uncharacterized protein n=1 Tax=Peronosclerospora sorghi TaxID=230839 RepID=A0ACC0WF36_9STRA|nr:hypothetical protein PsorP6_013287 [Peronosclerospora sorghi]